MVMPARMAMPPIVGVPRLRAWDAGPSSRISWPMARRLKYRISAGVRKIETKKLMIPAQIT